MGRVLNKTRHEVGEKEDTSYSVGHTFLHSKGDWLQEFKEDIV